MFSERTKANFSSEIRYYLGMPNGLAYYIEIEPTRTSLQRLTFSFLHPPETVSNKPTESQALTNIQEYKYETMTAALHPLNTMSSFSMIHGLDYAVEHYGIHEAIPFPWKLHEMLEDAVKNDFTNIVSWLPDHCSFRVHHPEAFVKEVMSRYFRQTKYKSFQRQLNMWGFERLRTGPCKGGYTHTNFVRGQPALCHRMKRLKIKGTGNKSLAKSFRPQCVRDPSLNKSVDEDVLFDEGTLLSVLSEAGDSTPNSAVPKEDDSVSFEGTNLLLNGEPSFAQFFDEQVLFDEDTLLSYLSLAIDNTPDSTQPKEGDCVLFEGMHFFFVEDYNDTEKKSPLNTPRASRRLSIEFQVGYSTSKSAFNRRLSIEPLVPIKASPSTAQEAAMTKRRRVGRRYSLERGRGGPREFNNFFLREINDLVEL